MKKTLSVLLAILICFCFAGCDLVNKILRWGATVPPSYRPTTTYYGVAQTMEGNEGLFVYIDGVGLCDIPTYEAQEITVKEGDILVMKFYADELAIMECYPARFSLPANYMEVVDFSFSLTWGIFGHSSYDSKTGRLVKTDDISPNDDYVATHYLTPQEKLKIFSIIEALDVYSYPDEYNPTLGIGSDPYQTLILSVYKAPDYIPKTITASEVALGNATSLKGKRFMDACEDIADILESTEEWKAMPDFPFYYE